MPDWDSLSADEKKVYARMMEVFAGFLTHTDYHIGRLLVVLKSIGELDNTLIMLISDNGASAEGGPHGSVNENKFFNNVPDSLEENLQKDRRAGRPGDFQPLSLGLGVCGQHALPALEARDLPRRRQRPVHRPLAEGHQGQGRSAGRSTRTRSTWCRRCSTRSVSNAPTTINGVTQSPIEGVSFAHVLDRREGGQPAHTQYFEMFGHRSIYHDGWRAVCPWPGDSFKESGLAFGAPITHDKLTELDAKNWELYHIEKDWAENHNLAGKQRDKLIEMIAMWYVEAGKYHVLPIDSRGTLRSGGSQTADRGSPQELHLLSRDPAGAIQRFAEPLEPASQHHRRR